MTMASTKTSLRGNQLGQALARAMNTTVLPAKNPPFVAAPVDEAALLREIRTWFARLVAGDTVPARNELNLPGHRRQVIVDRLKARGLIVVKTGAFGGATATPKLVELAREDIDDDGLRAIALVDLSDEERESALVVDDVDKQEEVVGVVDGNEGYMPDPLPPYAGPERDARFVADVREWLRRAVDGGMVRSGQMARVGTVYNVASRMHDAGLLERIGVGGMSRYTVPAAQRERALSLTDDEIVGFIWPARAQQVVQDLDEEITPELAQTFYPQEGDAPPMPEPADPVAVLFDQLLQVLLRMDARFARLERELGLAPIEQEVSK